MDPNNETVDPLASKEAKQQSTTSEPRISKEESITRDPSNTVTEQKDSIVMGSDQRETIIAKRKPTVVHKEVAEAAPVVLVPVAEKVENASTMDLKPVEVTVSIPKQPETATDAKEVETKVENSEAKQSTVTVQKEQVVVKAAAEKDQTKIDITEHLLSLDDLQVKTSVEFDPKKPSQSKGLTEAEVLIRQEKYGKNQLSPPKRIHPLLQFLLYFLQLFNVMLWVSGIVAYIIYALDPVENFSNVQIF